MPVLRRLLRLVLVFACLAAARPAATQSAPADAPRFTEAPCPFAAAPALLAQLRCGYLVVPENRSAPEGRQLRLAVAILRSTSPTPQPDPIVFLMGGPGQGFVQHAPRVATSGIWTPMRAERDLILFDQRGTGYSEPEFCPELDAEWERIAFLGLPREARAAHQRAALARCRETMLDQGADLSQYSSLASAHDLQDLRRALGISQWNLWGVSYGTRLALEALRSAPEGIRAAILDSPLPPNAAAWADGPEKLANVIGRLAARCAVEPACAAAYPDVAHSFHTTLEELERAPLVLRTRGDSIRVDAALLAEGVFLGLYRRSFHSVMPLFLREVQGRNEALLQGVARQIRVTPGTASLGLQWTVNCYEVAPFNGPAARGAPRSRTAALLERVGAGPDPAVCDALHPYRADPGQVEPVFSTVPTLLLAGEFDPTTPVAYAYLTAATLPNSQVVEIPGGGHWEAPRHECTRRLMRDFVADPSAPLDTTCLAAIPPVRFATDVRLVPGVARAASLLEPDVRALALPALAAPLLILLSAVVGWPAGALAGRVRRREQVARTPFERRARWGALTVALLALGLLATLALVVMRTAAENPFLLAFGLSASAAPLLLLPWLLLAGSLALLATAGLAWRRGAWSRWGRIHFTLVALASLTLATLLVAVGLV